MSKSFIEVIKTIKEGEVWESPIRRVELINGTVQISRLNGETFNDYFICFSNTTLYKLISD